MPLPAVPPLLLQKALPRRMVRFARRHAFALEWLAKALIPVKEFRELATHIRRMVRRMDILRPIAQRLIAAALAAPLVVPGIVPFAATPSMAAEPVAFANFTPRFSLTDTSGKAVRESDFRGQFVLMTFGYTYCPDVCPTTLQNVAQILDRLGADADTLVPLFVTIDPERDKPDHLAAYARAFHPRIRSLTGTADQIAETARHFGVIYRKSNVESAETYLMDHTARLYLVGRAGEPLGKFSHTVPPEELAQRIRQRMGGSGR